MCYVARDCSLTTLLPEDDLRIETCWSDFKCFNVKFYISAFVGVIIKMKEVRCGHGMWQKNSAGLFPVAEYWCSLLRFPLVKDSDRKYI